MPVLVELTVGGRLKDHTGCYLMIQLNHYPAYVINIPEQEVRRSHMSALLSGLQIKHTFIEGATGVGKIRGCALSHLRAIDESGDPPFMVFEDDVSLVWKDAVLPHIPRKADVIYLGTNINGCMPNTIENKEKFGHRSLAGLALATDFDEIYVRLHSMVSAHAILFLSNRAKKRFFKQLRIAHRRKTPLDVRYAYLMTELNVYALKTPMFVESMKLQVESKSLEERRVITHSPVPIAMQGDIRKAEKRGYNITVKAVEYEPGRMRWEVLELEKIDSKM